jgi:hypothetical protein
MWKAFDSWWKRRSRLQQWSMLILALVVLTVVILFPWGKLF